MKNITAIFFGIIFLTNLNGQDGQDSSLLAREWVVDYNDNVVDLSDVRKHYFIDSIFTFNGKAYYKLKCISQGKPCQGYYSDTYYRSNNKKLWTILGDNELLIEDFSLKAGDTMFNANDFLFESNFLVHTIDTIVYLDGKPRLAQTLSCSLFNQSSFSLIEGISSAYGMFDQILFCSAASHHSYSEWIRCYYENGNLVYKRPGIINCYEQKIVQTNRLWIYKDHNNWGNQTRYQRYKISYGTKLKNNINYKMVLNSTDSLGQVWKPTNLLVREEEGKVWMIYENSNEPEFLKIDMNMAVGDTLFDNSGNDLKVTKIDSVTLLNGSKRKRLSLNCLYNIGGPPDQTWIEGVGSTNEFFGSTSASCIIDATESDLQCYFEDGLQLIAPPFGNDCFIYFSSSTSDAKRINVSLSPIPASHHLTIDNLDSGYYDFSIYNSLGQLVVQGKWTNVELIDISGLASGLYFLELSDNQLSKSMNRFIKE